jgi:hypothetical protein
MKDKLVLRSYEYLMRDGLDRIKSGKNYDANFKPYDKEFIDKMISFFEEREEYENCETLVNFKNIRFDHNLNYKK